MHLTEYNDFFCVIKDQGNRFYYELHDHISMQIQKPQISSDNTFNPEQCKQSSGKRSLTLFDHELVFEKGRQNIHNMRYGSVNGE